MRAGQTVQVTEDAMGEVTSGGFSPTKSFNCISACSTVAEGEVTVARRGRWLAARVTKPAFVKHGKILIEGNT